MGEDPDEVEEFLYPEFDDALEVYGAIIGGSPAQAADHLRSPRSYLARSPDPSTTRITRTGTSRCRARCSRAESLRRSDLLTANKRTALAAWNLIGSS